MARRHLSNDEQAVWTALTNTVKPLRPGGRPVTRAMVPEGRNSTIELTQAPRQTVAAVPVRTPAAVLDNGWERRIRSGTLVPDMSVDLHGHNLAAAHTRLNQTLTVALARDVRVLLVITGKPPKKISDEGSRRGAIRAEIGHWLETSAYADRIASVRVAHPRHGGDGALYIILRRKK